MFKQLLTPVAGSLPLSFIVAALPVAAVLVLLGVMRRPAWQASLAGLVVGLIIAIAVWDFPASLAFNSVAAGVVFALWPVMWIVVNALLLYNIAVEFEAVRRLPCVGSQPSSQRSPRCAGRDRLLLRRAARRHRRLRHAGRDHFVASHPRGLPGARSVGVHVDLQHRAGRLRRARRSGDDARRGHRPARGYAWRHDRPPAAVHRAFAAFLRNGALWRHAFAEGAVAGASGRRRLLRALPVRLVELHQLRADGRLGVARLADRDAPVPAGVETSARSGIRCAGRSRTSSTRIRTWGRGKGGCPGSS